jgi:hypothetical protein
MFRWMALAASLAACGVNQPAENDETDSRGAGVAAACPDPADPTVHYVSTDPAQCAAATIRCSDTQTFFDGACGCGCIDAPTSTCPDPADPKVHYLSTELLTCAAAFFQCTAAQTTFDDACGCID